MATTERTITLDGLGHELLPDTVPNVYGYISSGVVYILLMKAYVKGLAHSQEKITYVGKSGTIYNFNDLFSADFDKLL